MQKVLKKYKDNSVDLLCTDPPYGYGFMGRDWDKVLPDIGIFQECFRVLKPGGHFSISDIVLVGDLPKALKEDAEMYAGCVAGAIQKEEYLKHISDQGFVNVNIQKEKPITIPEDILSKYLDEEMIKQFNSDNVGIFSITVYAEKPGKKEKKPKLQLADITNDEPCCSPDGNCC